MSFDLGVDIQLNSQDSNLCEEDLQNILEESKATNTKKCTNWGVKKLMKWLEKRDMKVDLKTIKEESLTDTLNTINKNKQLPIF